MEQSSNKQKPPLDQQTSDKYAVTAFILTLVQVFPISISIFSANSDYLRLGGMSAFFVIELFFGIPCALIATALALQCLKTTRYKILAYIGLLPAAFVVFMILMGMLVSIH